ncbi:hypothetical protein [Nostoc sp.]|uniref:hypothetical protein n=1 Tax=Nostoc sp. TaxID=1180 RepID=UPI002FFB3689
MNCRITRAIALNCSISKVDKAIGVINGEPVWNGYLGQWQVAVNFESGWFVCGVRLVMRLVRSGGVNQSSIIGYQWVKKVRILALPCENLDKTQATFAALLV